LDASQSLPQGSYIIATDPPYYDNIGYADLSDFFYVWLRHMVGRVYPDLFATLLTPKVQELVATPFRFNGSRDAADRHFEEGLARAFGLVRSRSDSAPITLYYAFKQAEEVANGDGTGALVSTGWQTMLEGLVQTGFEVVGTWPVRTERAGGFRNKGQNALASSIVLVCRPRPDNAPIATRREFLAALREDLPGELRILTGHGTTHPVSPVDLAQATIGPGMAVFSRYSKVLEASGEAMSVRTALQLINQAIEDYFTEQEGELDADTQFCARWFEQYGFNEGKYGDAEVIARAKNIGIDSLARDGVLESRAGKVNLQPLAYYVGRWEGYDPVADTRRSVWEACHYLIAALQEGGEGAAARLARRLGGWAESGRDLAYRLYSICDRKGWSEQAQPYNALVSSWPEIQKQAAALAEETQGRMV
jgi:putative DNA methylase